ncbi:putative galactose oxidase/kelch, beta-propeller, kelch-type beta propeller [Dioscorea sansibarensis]
MEVIDGDGSLSCDPFSVMPYDQWVLINCSGSRPPGRYKHAAEVFQEKLYVVGGSRNGRYLSDLQVFDLRTLKWSQLRLKVDTDGSKPEDSASALSFPASAGHSLVIWENKLLVIAGHQKSSSDTVTVWSIDPETGSCHVAKTDGKVPTARGGQSVTLVGSRVIMFGGEDRKRRLLNDLYILDLETMFWDVLEVKKQSPAPRFDHTAAVQGDQYLLIFGGSSYSTCFNDLHILDLQSMDWAQSDIRGAGVSPRGGHAAVAVDENWFIVGGGDNSGGAPETLVLNMPKLVWSIVTSVGQRDPLASEGLTLCSATVDGEKLLIAFGGYNGKYNNEVFILKTKKADSTRPRLLQSPAAAAAAASVTAVYALTTAADKENTVIVEEEKPKRVQAQLSTKVVANSDALSAEKKILESRLMEIRAENLKLKGNIDDLNNSHTELSIELQSVQSQLAAESSRCLKLEEQIAEMQKKLLSLNSIEQELVALRDQKTQIEIHSADLQKQRSGGVWNWVTGAS